MQRPFVKMHGIGNDFVIFDARQTPVSLSRESVVAIADRHTGVGCDQVIVMEAGNRNKDSSLAADRSQPPTIFMRIYNADGGEVANCGNATRCVAWLMMEESGKGEAAVQTEAGLLHCKRLGKNKVCADMGAPKLDWREIPLSEPRDTLNLGFSFGEFHDPVAVSMGNPHAVFIVPDVKHLRIRDAGPALEHWPLFPERANISFAQPVDDRHIRLRVWERGVGETQGCGTAACATLVALNRRGLVGRGANIELPGGTLEVEWDEKTGHVFMTGEVAVSFRGVLSE